MEDKTIEINGKKYIEFNEAKHIKYGKARDIIFLVLIAFAVIALVMAIMSLLENRDIINRDALIIGMEQHGFVNCQCFDEQGKDWYSTDGGFIHKDDQRPRTNLSGFNLSGI